MCLGEGGRGISFVCPSSRGRVLTRLVVIVGSDTRFDRETGLVFIIYDALDKVQKRLNTALVGCLGGILLFRL